MEAAAAAASKSCLELCAMFPCYPSIVCAPFRHIKTSTELNRTEQNSTQTDSTWLHFSFISCGIPHQRRVVRFYECIIKLERTNLRERAKNVFQILFLYAYVPTNTYYIWLSISGCPLSLGRAAIKLRRATTKSKKKRKETPM